MQTNDLDLGGVTVRAVEVGPRRSPAVPLLLLHGFTGSSLDWYDVMPLLGRHRRVIAIDHRGHGDSTNLGDPASYSFDALLSDLGQAVDALGLERFHLVGHSMGGVIAMRYALTAREKLASLVLVDTAAAPAGSLPTDVIDNLVATGRSQGMTAVADLILTWLPAPSEVHRERARQKLETLDVEALGAFAEELQHYPDLLPALGMLQLPTTVICGANDDLLPACQRLAAGIPSAELKVIADAGHSPFEDQREQWVALVDAHMLRAEACSAG